MTLTRSNKHQMDLHSKTRQLLDESNYSKVANLYEQAIENEPDVISHYWYLGLAYLLQGYEQEAQTTWMLAIAEAMPEQAEEWTEALVDVLDVEAQHQLKINQAKNSWLIRQHIKQIYPISISNLLKLIELSIDLQQFSIEDIEEWQVLNILQTASDQYIDLTLLLKIIKQLLTFNPTSEIVEFIEACQVYFTENQAEFINTLIVASIKIGYQDNQPDIAVKLAELCLELKPRHSEALRHLSCFYSRANLHQKAIETAKQYFDNAPSTILKIQGSYLVLRALLTAGSWREIPSVAEQHKSLVTDLINNPPESFEPSAASLLLTANFFLPYIQDHPQENRWLQNQVCQLLQDNLKSLNYDLTWSNSKEKNRPLKIGYVAHTLKGHSVGWLSRWLFVHSNKEAFKTNFYLIHQQEEDHQFFRDKVDKIHLFGADPEKIAAQIKEDEIDILVDLDSLTLDITCKVMALKPSPIQVTWLGWDVSGIPTIDYFIADPYVLPENAQEYYQETIWRLPQTYVAVDGFEIGIPTLRREDLEIPPDAVIYLSSQIGCKRNPATIRLQMQIIKQVPNSYFLIKGLGDEKIIQELFTQIAESEGCESSRLKFLPRDPSEFVHRANLAIADIVLDTYPYNGATTTLETLWMGIPLVTRVGEQFAARNSYAFMKNVGVEEGIAWTDEEYVEWGVRLGKDSALRQQIAWKLRQSRQTSPLWNGKEFTREMEKAYQQMWETYISK